MPLKDNKALHAYYKRKLEEVRKMVDAAIDDPSLVSGLVFTDGIVAINQQTGVPVISIKLDINEPKYSELKSRV